MRESGTRSPAECVVVHSACINVEVLKEKEDFAHYKYNPVHYQIILFVSELFLLYCPLFLFNFCFPVLQFYFIFSVAA